MSTKPSCENEAEYMIPTNNRMEPSPDHTEAWKLAQESPEYALQQSEAAPKILFLASQIGMKATEDWRIRAEWTAVYLKAIGPSSNF